MAVALVHIIDVPVGVWGVSGDDIAGFYADGNADHATRALAILVTRPAETAWEDHFADMAADPDLPDSYELTIVGPREPLSAVFFRYLRGWKFPGR